MHLAQRLNGLHAFQITAAVAVVGLGLVGYWFGFTISASTALITWDTLRPNAAFIDNHSYRVQIFSRDPLVVIIDSFVSSKEIAHLLHKSNNHYKASLVYGDEQKPIYDPNMRVSESVTLSRKDPVVRRIEERAKSFQGWRGNNTVMQLPAVQRYQVGGFFDYHYDWDPRGKRATSFMVYLVANCTAGGTNFPYLKRPNGTAWCHAIECTEEGIDGYQGVTFKPRAGSAVFWENYHPNGTLHEGVFHAGLPVKSGVKVGLNMWSWEDLLT